MTVRRLIVVLSTPTADAAALALRYAATAAALDVPVELHVVSAGAVGVFSRRAVSGEMVAPLQQALEAGAEAFVCPAALAEQGLRAEELIDGFAGIRGAASLLAAGLAPGARFLSF